MIRTKKYVQQVIQDFDDYISDTLIVDIKEKLNKLLEMEAQGWKNLRIRKEYCPYDDGYSFNIVGERLETDAEFNHRVAIETAKAKKKAREQIKTEQAEKELLKKLKAKYDGND